MSRVAATKNDLAAEWDASDSPGRMLDWITGRAGTLKSWVLGERKLRLWVEACRAAGQASDYVANLGEWAGLRVALEYWRSLDAARDVPSPLRAALLRCVAFNPHRRLEYTTYDGLRGSAAVPLARAPSLARTLERWVTPTVAAVAGDIYESRAFDELPVLADALEDAGCDAALMIEHLRSPGPHCLGCWPLDLVLWKE